MTKSGEESEEVAFDPGFTFDMDDTKAPQIIDELPKVQDALAVKIAEIRKERNLPQLEAEEHSEAQESSVSESESEHDDDEEEMQLKTKGFYSDYVPVGGVKSFGELNLSKPLLKALTEMGFSKPTPIQAAAIPVALAGRDLCGGAETGSGKTAAFLLPILERLLQGRHQAAQTRVLILLPTRELAVQCHEVALKLCKYASRIQVALAAGGLPVKPQEAALRARPDMVIGTPGRIIDHLANAPGFDLDRLEILVLDEADRMLEEGFEDELNQILEQLGNHGQRQTMLFSASLDDNIQSLMRLALRKPVRLQLDSSMAIARRLTQEFVRVRGEGAEEDRLVLLAALAVRTCSQRCIVFLPTKELTHRCRILFGLLGLAAAELHGGLSQPERLASLNRFKEGKVTHLLCTDVAARGIDVQGVESVLNYSMPVKYQQYLHRVGRTARAGQKGRSISLVGEGADRKMLKLLQKNSTESLKHRLIPASVISQYRQMIADLQPDLKRLLEEELVDRQLEKAEEEVKRAENLMKHGDEIKARPAREWFQSSKQKDRSKRKEQRQVL